MRILIKNKKILITGIYGFLGKHLAECLQHDNEIIGINKLDESKNFEFNNVNVIEGDIADVKLLEKINGDIDLIFQKHANERRKFLAKSEKINEKISSLCLY